MSKKTSTKKLSHTKNLFTSIIYVSFTAQADAEYTAKLAARGFSETEVPEKEKPSTIITTMENYITNGVKELVTAFCW